MKPKLLNKFGKPLAYSSHYKATQQHRERRYIPNVATDVSQTLGEGTRKELIALSRFLYNNSSLCSGALNSISENAIGSGLKAQSLASPDVAGEYEDYFNKWSEICDSQGKFSLAQIQYLVSLAVDRDGDVGIALSKTATGWPQISVCESHRITSKHDDKKFYEGVATDKYGRVKGYKILAGDNYRTFSPRDFILVYEPSRVGMLRGVTSLTSVINTLSTVDDLLAWEATGCMVTSSVGYIIKSAEGEANDGSSFIEDGFSSADTGGLAVDSLSSGMIPRLAQGESIESLGGGRPSATFNGFIDHLIRSLSVGLGLPYSFLWSPEGLNAAGQRLILKKAERTFQRRQTLIANKMMKRLWSWVIASGVSRGDLKPSDNWYAVRFIADKMISIDISRDSANVRADVLLGIKTLSEVQAESGKSWEDVRNQSYTEADNLLVLAAQLSKAHGITLDAAITLLSARTGSGQPFEVNDPETEQNS